MCLLNYGRFVVLVLDTSLNNTLSLPSPEQTVWLTAVLVPPAVCLVSSCLPLAGYVGGEVKGRSNL